MHCAKKLLCGLLYFIQLEVFSITHFITHSLTLFFTVVYHYISFAFLFFFPRTLIWMAIVKFLYREELLYNSVFMPKFGSTTMNFFVKFYVIMCLTLIQKIMITCRIEYRGEEQGRQVVQNNQRQKINKSKDRWRESLGERGGKKILRATRALTFPFLPPLENFCIDPW